MATRWELKTPAVCLPVSVFEEKKHLRLDEFYTDEDEYINVLISAASYDTENITNRVLVSSVWEWFIEDIQTGVEVEFPIIPVTKVVIYDNDLPSVNPDLAEGETEEVQFNIVPENLYSVNYPSLAPQGSPLVGSISFSEGFPTNVTIELTAGYAVEEEEVLIIPEEGDPDFLTVLVPESIGYEAGESDPETLEITKLDNITLVFSKKIKSVMVEPTNFRIYDVDNDLDLTVDSVDFDDVLGIVNLKLPVGSLVAGMNLTLSFLGGIIEDGFNHFVGIITDNPLPTVELPRVFTPPSDNPKKIIYTSKCPEPIKQRIMVRAATIYQQRSEIALRAGKSNDAMFPREFIDSLLDPYIVRKMY